jgi:hypothetical protein
MFVPSAYAHARVLLRDAHRGCYESQRFVFALPPKPSDAAAYKAVLNWDAALARR